MLVSVKNVWRRSVALSCAVHLTAFVLLGLAPLQHSRPAEEVLINLNIEPNEVSELSEQPLDNVVTETSGAAVIAQAQPQRSASRSQATKKQAVGGNNVPSAAVGSSGSAGSALAASGSADGEAGYGGTGGDGVGEAGSGEGGGEAEAGGGIDIGALGNAFAARVDSCKEYPYMAMRRGQTGVVSVFVRLAADGSLAAVEVTGSSGVASLDDSAVKAVQRACPFAHGAGRSIEFVVPIYYELRG